MTVRRVLVIVQVVKGIMHVTTAGVVGSWWFSPHVRGDVVLQSIKQSVTTSFGSVCFGSLIVIIDARSSGTHGANGDEPS